MPDYIWVCAEILPQFPQLMSQKGDIVKIALSHRTLGEA